MKYALAILILSASVVFGQPTLANSDDITAAKARANHTGTQAHTTITGLGTAATAASGDFATAAQGVLAGTALQAANITGPTRIPENGPPVTYVPAADTDTARFAAWTLAHTALQTGETLICPSGDYYITTNFINLKAARYVFQNSRFYINGSTAAGGGGPYADWTFWASSLTGLSIDGNLVLDGGSVAGKRGIVIQNCWGADLNGVWFKNFGTYGLWIAGDGATKTPSKSATNLRFTANGTGVHIDAGGEYWTFTGCHFDACTIGVTNAGGNNMFFGCQITLCGTGFTLANGSNAGHGSFVGGTVNHCTGTGVKVNASFPLGFQFVGSHFFANGSGGIDLGGKGVTFTACEIDSAITCTSVQDGIHYFRGCTMPLSSTVITSLTAPQRANIKFYDCKTLTGEWANNDARPVPIYTVATLPPASASTYGTCAVTDATTPTVGSTVTGGGAVKALVTSNGTTWTVTAIP